MMAHMRCGSTALSNILCSRGDINGYGETHVRFDENAALGRLMLNIRRRVKWSSGADYVFDKVLHSQLHRHATAEFFEARAIFVIREPEPSIRSICNLYEKLGYGKMRQPEAAAEYYLERLRTLSSTWEQFAADRRFGMTHRGLLGNPDLALAQLSENLAFDPPLSNSYQSTAASRAGGGGDPLVSGQHTRIESTLLVAPRPIEELGLPVLLASAAQEEFLRLRDRIAQQCPDTAV